MRNTAIAMTGLLLVASVAPMMAAGATVQESSAYSATQEASAYSGAHVAFETEASGIVDYAVENETVAESIRVQSRSEVESDMAIGIGGDFDLGAVTDIAGSAVSLQSQTQASATVQVESGATVRAHDTDHGELVVTANDSEQVVAVGLNQQASAESESDDRVVVTTGDGTQSAFIVVGEGDVTVNDQGNVTATLHEDSRLVTRSYTEARTDDDESEERMIANGTAAASVYVTQQGGEAVTDVVNYGQHTTIEVTERSENEVRMTVERTEHEGRVVITSVSESAFESAEDIQVQVDGEAAARASSYAELRQAASGTSSDEPSRFMVQQSTSAEASADVLVAVNHFSTREITMTDGSTDSQQSTDDGEQTTESDDSQSTDSDDSQSTDSDDSDSDASNEDGSDGDSSGGDGASGETTSGTGPGFGVLGALAALAGLALLGRRQ